MSLTNRRPLLGFSGRAPHSDQVKEWLIEFLDRAASLGGFEGPVLAGRIHPAGVEDRVVGSENRLCNRTTLSGVVRR